MRSADDVPVPEPSPAPGLPASVTEVVVKPSGRLVPAGAAAAAAAAMPREALLAVARAATVTGL